MKKQILILVIISLIVQLTNAQQLFVPSNNESNPGIGTSTTGNVGVGTSSPNAGLHVITADNSTGNYITAILGNAYNHWTYFGGTIAGRIRGSNEGYLCVGSNPNGQGDKRLYLNQDSPGDVSIAVGGGNVGIGTSSPLCKMHVEQSVNGELNFLIKNTYGTGTRTFLTATPDKSLIQTDRDFAISTNGGGWSDKFIVKNDGSVGIGTTTPGYKLDVCGTIRAKEVKVDLAGGCDFVFKKDYKLMDLKTLEKYVTTNQHLPEIASEKEMIANGLTLNEMQLKLLQKIEELTLYTIEQNKKLEKQNEKIQSLEEKIEKLTSDSK